MSKYELIKAQGFATNNPVLEKKLFNTIMITPPARLKTEKGIQKVYFEILKKFGTLETMERDHIYMALLILADKVPTYEPSPLEKNEPPTVAIEWTYLRANGEAGVGSSMGTYSTNILTTVEEAVKRGKQEIEAKHKQWIVDSKTEPTRFRMSDEELDGSIVSYGFTGTNDDWLKSLI